MQNKINREKATNLILDVFGVAHLVVVFHFGIHRMRLVMVSCHRGKGKVNKLIKYQSIDILIDTLHDPEQLITFDDNSSNIAKPIAELQ